MSKSFLPPEVGVSTKVAFVGVESGSPEAQRLYALNAGAISRFHAKARQARGDRPSAHMHQAVPGGKLTYSFNNGLEIVTVELTPETERTRSEPFVPPEPPEPVLAPLLAIDVLFDPEKFEVGEVFAYTETTETVTIPGAPIGDPSNPDNWDFTGWDIQYTTTGDGTPILDATIAGINPAHFDSVLVAEQWLFLKSTPPPLYYPSQLPGLDYSTNPPIDTSVLWIIAIIQYTAGEGWRYGFADDQQVVTIGLGGGGWSQDDWLGPRGPDRTETTTVRRYTRELRTYFDILTVVGAKVEADPDNPDDTDYTADSTGASTDARLVPVNTGSRTITRTLAISGDGDPGFVGHCFLAQPKSWPPPPNQPPDPIEIKLYAASYNVSQSNSFPGKIGSAFGVDDDSMSYEPKTELKVKVRAREFVGPTPVGVMVSLSSEGLVERWRSPSADAYPDQENGTQTIAGARTEEWAFAASATWQDGGNEPADPAAVDGDGEGTMGELLDEEGYADITVGGPDPLGREVPTSPSWSRPVDAMTQIGYVTWTPPDIENDQEHGTAEIVLFGGLGGGGGGL